jgi:DNA-binding transcriptional LysR family regulator
MLDLGRLRMLDAVATHGSINAAAEALGYTASAISQQLSKLERETGCGLLERHGRGVRLTEPGALLAGSARRILADVERAEAELESRRETVAGPLVIAAFPAATRDLLPEVVLGLRRRHPRLETRLYEAGAAEAVSVLLRGDADLALLHDWRADGPDLPELLEHRLLGEDAADLVVPADHPLAGAGTVAFAALGEQEWVRPPAGSVAGDWIASALREHGCAPALSHQVEQTSTQLALVAAGLGISLIPRLGRGQLPPGLTVLTPDPLPVARMYLVWRAASGRRPALVAGRAAVRRQWAAHQRALHAPMLPAARTPTANS